MDKISILTSLKEYTYKHRKRIVYFGIGSSVLVYLYKRFLSEHVQTMRDLYTKISEIKEVMNMDPALEITQSSLTNIIPKIITEIKTKIENHFSITNCYTALQNAKERDEITKMWIFFKNKAFMSFYSSIFVPRCILLLSQTHLIILEKTKKQKEVPKIFYENIMCDLWVLAVEFIEHVSKCIENRLSSFVDNIVLNKNLTPENFTDLLNEVRLRVETFKFDINTNEIRLDILQTYIEKVEYKIKILNQNNFTNDSRSLKVETFLNFYNMYYDILTSNLFQVILIKSLDYDFQIVEDILKLNFENENKNGTNQFSVAKIASILNKLRGQFLQNEHTVLNLPNYKNSKFEEEKNEYFRIIFE